MRFFVSLLCLSLSFKGIAQIDSLLSKTKIKYEFDFDAGFYLMGVDKPFSGINDGYHLPYDIQLDRWFNFEGDYSVSPRGPEP